MKRISVLIAVSILMACEPPMSEWPRSSHCHDGETNDQCILRLEHFFAEQTIYRHGPTVEELEEQKQFVISVRRTVETKTVVVPSAPSVPPPPSEEPPPHVNNPRTNDGVSEVP